MKKGVECTAGVLLGNMLPTLLFATLFYHSLCCVSFESEQNLSLAV